MGLEVIDKDFRDGYDTGYKIAAKYVGARKFWRGYLLGVLTGAGLVCAFLLFSCTPSGTQPPHQADLYPNGDTVTRYTGPDMAHQVGVPMPLELRSGIPWPPWSRDPGVIKVRHYYMDRRSITMRQHIWHLRERGKPPFMWISEDHISGDLIGVQMTGGVLPDSGAVIELYRSEGRP